MNSKMICFFTALGLITPSFAFFCPTNFSQIEMGMTLDQVTATCGKPTTIKEVTKENDNVPQEWNYFIPQSVGVSAFQQTQGTLKTSIAFDADGKAVNISVNGLGVGASTICGGQQIQLGDSKDTISKACGDPTFKNKADNNNPPTKETQVTYDSNPPQTLIFRNGLLMERQ